MRELKWLESEMGIKILKYKSKIMKFEENAFFDNSDETLQKI